MKILHLATFLQGGAGRVITDLAVAQSRAGHDVSLVASQTGAPGYGNYQAYLNELEANGVALRLIDSMFSREIAANMAVVRFLDADFRDEPPDVIHTHAAIPSLVALLVAGSRRCPMAIVQTMHGWGVNKTPAQVQTDVALIDLVDRVVVPSRHSADTLCALGVSPTRIEVVPYGVTETLPSADGNDEDALAAVREARARGEFVVACVGTIGPRKNQALLVEAMALAKPRVNVFGLFVGDGDSRGLLDAADRAGVRAATFARGYSRAARTLAASADVLVLPSRSEGQPLAILEAFSDRTLVAVSDIPELAELVDDGVTGVHFAADSSSSLASTLVRLAMLSGPVRQEIQDQAHARYLTRFTAQAMIAAYQSLYETRLQAHASSRRPQVPSAA